MAPFTDKGTALLQCYAHDSACKGVRVISSVGSGSQSTRGNLNLSKGSYNLHQPGSSQVFVRVLP
jgi:hypothetical protein